VREPARQKAADRAEEGSARARGLAMHVSVSGNTFAGDMLADGKS
jgi:hypothetical protein